MQISRHWRIQPERYRLEGERDLRTGQVSITGHRYTPEQAPIRSTETEHTPSPVERALAVAVVLRK